MTGMNNPRTNPSRYPLDRARQLREAVLSTFCDPVSEQCLLLLQLSDAEWHQLLLWLDTSGLALYFFDRLSQLGLGGLLPPQVVARLQQNLIDNTARMHAMISESAEIQRAFQSAGMVYATLKGFSLWPHSVPALELRSQLDLDFLMAESSAQQARRILEARGYLLRAISGRSWEFKKDESAGTSLRDLYKALSHRTVELHIETDSAGGDALLSRIERRYFHGIDMPVLSPIDLFLGQGQHLYKHVCSEFSRTAHLIEFRRHVMMRAGDHAFWRELRSHAEQRPIAPIALGVVTLLIGQVMGSFAPELLTNWTVNRLPPAARLWVELYGRQSVFAPFPGNKMYLLLQKELETAGIAKRRSLRRALLPLRLPPAVVQASVNETFAARLRRYRGQLRFIFFRLRFHAVEGFRYLIEFLRWRQHLNGLAQ